ncbi:MAG TPA: antibiotic biosynthesis monooxygenase [Dehalococcoidia bacterium]|nr:antibiotic biosynthesis monooxygenase [Dehalococcoidia bacterium]
MKGIFVWKARPGEEAEFERRWRAVSEALQAYPGARGTRLHRGITDPALFAGYASWDSLADREGAQSRLRAERADLRDMAEVSEMLFAGFFEEPHIVVAPQGATGGQS